MAAHVAATREDLTELARPLTIVVAKRAARRSTLAFLTRSLGHSVAGVDVRTTEAFALGLLERTGQLPPRGDRLLGLLTARAARTLPALEQPLADLEDGFSPLQRGLTELLEAGLTPASAEALSEQLDDDEDPIGPFPARRRARALIELAREVEHRREKYGAGGRHALLDAARRIVDDPSAVDAERVIFVLEGEERGTSLDLIEDLVRLGATAIVPHPRDTAGVEAPRSVAYNRLSGYEHRELERSAAVERRTVRASDPEAEARWALEHALESVEQRFRAFEDVAIVVADADSHAAHLRVHAERLGLPLSAGAVRGGHDPLTAPAHALFEVLRTGERTPVSRLLDAVDPERWLGPEHSPGTARTALLDLRAGLATLGVARLADLCELDLGRRLDGADGLTIRVRRGSQATEEPDPDAGDSERDEASPTPASTPAPDRARRTPKRRVAADLFRRAIHIAEAVRDQANLPGRRRTVAAARAALEPLLEEQLGWDRPGAPWRAFENAAAALAADLPPDFALDDEEWFEALGREATLRARTAIGGRGGGLQVLTHDEARGLTFEVVILLGLERGRFPRAPREDALLPDRVRARLRDLLPDLALSREHVERDRRTFLDLVGSAPEVVLAWSESDESGAQRLPSPLLGLSEEQIKAAHRAGPVLSREGRGSRPRPAYEHAIEAGLNGLTDADGRAFALVRAETERRAAPSPVELRAGAARARLIDAVDRTPTEGADGLDAWAGAIGPVRELDPAHSALYATRLEDQARCAWKAFLGRNLGLEPPADPIATLPSVDARMLGNVVHDTLEGWVVQNRPPEQPPVSTVGEARAAGPFPVPAPRGADFEELLARTARKVLEREGLPHPGLIRVAIERARPMLEVVCRLDWPDGGERMVLGAELKGEAKLADSTGTKHSIHFKADRVDHIDGRDHLVDYKTSKPLSEDKTPKTREKKKLKALATGKRLQALLYAAEQLGIGRYLFLRVAEPEDYADVLRRVDFDLDDEVQARTLDEVGRVLLDSLRLGVVAPRLVQPNGKEGEACQWCELTQACVRGDSSARGRLEAFAERRRGGVASDDPLLESWSALHELAANAPAASSLEAEGGA